MVRPRFHKLPPTQQAAILRAATDEFAAQGFSAASLNRIIDAAGISKGSMYYYFDGKEDLYAHVARIELGRLFEVAGPFPVPDARHPDAFWSQIEGHYLRIMRALVASPQLAALARDWLTAAANPALQEAQKDMERALIPWFDQAIAVGQRARAMRKDLPASLLIAVMFSMSQAMEAWLIAQQPDRAAFEKWVPIFIGMIRGAVA